MQQIFVNLPVTDLEKSKGFYTALGFTINEQFTNEQGACVVISDTIFVMLLTRDFFATFTDKSSAMQENRLKCCCASPVRAGSKRTIL
jgi:uncharacterized protein